MLAMAGVSNSWASGGHIACRQSCQGPHDVFRFGDYHFFEQRFLKCSPQRARSPKKGHYLSSISTPLPLFRYRSLDIEFLMPEEGRWCGDAGEVMTFFWRSSSLRAALQKPLPEEAVIVSRAVLKEYEDREFDTPGVRCFWFIKISQPQELCKTMQDYNRRCGRYHGVCNMMLFICLLSLMIALRGGS